MATSRTWVVTGVSSGLGLALALHVAAQGDKVIGTVRSLAKFPEQLKKAGVRPLVVDFSAPDEVIRTASQDALELFGTVDVLVNNAANGFVKPIEELDVQDLRAQFQTNFFGLFVFTQPFVTHFRTRRTGHILNISSYAGSIPLPCWGAYGATKAALDIFSDVLSLELKLFGVRVITVPLGYFASSFLTKASTHDSAAEGETAGLSQVYTDPVTQGYDIVRRTPKAQLERKQIGDPEKYAQRVYEMVTGTGLAKGLAAQSTGGGTWEGPWEFNHMPLGADCYSRLKERLDLLGENLRALESVTTSTNIDEDRLQHFSRG